MKKIIIFIVALIIIFCVVYLILFKSKTEPENNNQVVGGDKDENGCIGSAGYSWCQAKEKCLRVFEEFCPDVVADLITRVQQASNTTFSLKGGTSFNWIVYDGNNSADKNISGVLYQIDDIKWADYEKIEKFFNDNYGMDSGNVADGVQGGQRGYLIDYLACILNFRHNQLKQVPNAPTQIVGDSLNVKLECGYFNPNDIPKIMLEQKIKEILSAKYKKPVSETWVSVTKSTETHASGTVVFSKDGQGEGGLFLAVKVNDKWNVVYDGNGAVDCTAMRATYQFPDEILKPNFCD